MPTGGTVGRSRRCGFAEAGNNVATFLGNSVLWLRAAQVGFVLPRTIPAGAPVPHEPGAQRAEPLSSPLPPRFPEGQLHAQRGHPGSFARRGALSDYCPRRARCPEPPAAEPDR